MKLAEYRAHDAALAEASALPPKTKADIVAARAARDAAGLAWEQARNAWYAAVLGRGQDKCGDKAGRLDDLAAQKGQTQTAYEAAERRLRSLQFDADLNKAIRVRAVKAEWRKLVAERAHETLPRPYRIRVFDSEAERDAAYSRAG